MLGKSSLKFRWIILSESVCAQNGQNQRCFALPPLLSCLVEQNKGGSARILGILDLGRLEQNKGGAREIPLIIRNCNSWKTVCNRFLLQNRNTESKFPQAVVNAPGLVSSGEKSRIKPLGLNLTFWTRRVRRVCTFWCIRLFLLDSDTILAR